MLQSDKGTFIERAVIISCLSSHCCCVLHLFISSLFQGGFLLQRVGICPVEKIKHYNDDRSDNGDDCISDFIFCDYLGGARAVDLAPDLLPGRSTLLLWSLTPCFLIRTTHAFHINSLTTITHKS